ncbi:hypothetical protein SATMO3_18050 [Sporomusa aerivorans]
MIKTRDGSRFAAAVVVKNDSKQNRLTGSKRVVGREKTAD